MKINTDNLKKTILFILLFTLFIYVLLRAYYLSFTCDESESFKILIGGVSQARTANNHLLNTFLMSICYKLFGGKEIFLRIPNVLAFILYAFFCYKILSGNQNIFFMILGISLLLLNPYLLDFFSLARGYGLSLGFALGSLYFIFRQDNKVSYRHYLFNLSASLSLSLMATFSNYAFINLNISLIIVFVIELFLSIKNKKIDLSRNQSARLVFVFFANTLGLMYLMNSLFILKNNNQLYFGGKNNFIEDTLTILIHRSIYNSYYGEVFWMRIRQFIIILFVIILIYQLIVKKYNSLSKALIILTLMIYSCVLQHYIFDTPYPMERTALIFIPLFGFLILFFIEEFISNLKPYFHKFVYLLLITFISLPLTYHFIKNLNLSVTKDWFYDANTKFIMNEIKAYHAKEINANRRISISNDWMFEPTINFYRVIYSMDYLEPATTNGINRNADFIYCSEDSIISGNNFQVINRFESTRTQLIIKQ